MKKKDAYNENEFVHDVLDYLIAKQEVDQIRLMKMIKLEKRNKKAIKFIEHELNEHILLNDEVTWNDEYYTKGKLDYRKLLIALLQDILNILKGGK